MAHPLFIAVDDSILDELRIKDDELLEQLFSGALGDPVTIGSAWVDVEEQLRTAGFRGFAVRGCEVIVGDPMVGLVPSERVEEMLDSLASLSGEAVGVLTDLYRSARAAGQGVVIISE
ncbi:hypothetical protein [Corynebacterium diphtheriae]|uniref:hypothetical protein n=1 Tax=Corynebacterium diphtheriae TaxID=1717 RepID=UPI00038FFE52|nr:hypothetical protein [Corynebacterium diphtheriae]ERA54040.1 hypothetical protein B179_01651 [Corynebacterium diphtheriae str. Aberdeen]KLN42814.1 hypothetical protein AL08_01735 [Corynebacterium diphtheriae bv. gravis str. ISS 4746]KLN44955.1 hypothetical protein AL09_01865 [Corynebacterium diphtheriae bv. gravis str. ISS 4749]MBG9368588.1 hypothetical protein [Corynebacterium diphtheriae bv. gravis]MBG9379490.1 hypothetical protein [Corynebacterium diphtheriae bv. gravis]